ncbi:MAG: saccharopine dehydrogenase [Saprospirales bacterium]|nr:MAG: saccharopine dehydrogenase [Saprospirales bacterium]
MSTILVIGAGRSSSALINYLLDQCSRNNWQLIVADMDLEMAKARIGNNAVGKAVQVDIMDINSRRELIKESDLVISLLPAFLHTKVARDCLEYSKHLVTASYVSSEMHELAEKARNKGLMFMGEMGLDPGIDHMSAMEKLDEIKADGGNVHSFKSYTGGLIAPESDDNPWHYKFTWNPRNVILAGQGTAQFLKNGRFKYIPYNRLFTRYDLVDIQGMGSYEMYPNRDSLLYRFAYNIEDIPTIIRGTLRHKGFCDAWNVFIRLGLTDDTYPIVNSEYLTYKEFVQAYLLDDSNRPLVEKVADFIGVHKHSEVMKKIEWTGLFSDEKIGISNATPAKILEHLLRGKWNLKPEDKDMIIMQHEFEYTLGDKAKKLTSTMILKGENAEDTAMSKLVGLPLAIFVTLFLKGTPFSTDSSIPVKREIYAPVLKELEEHGVIFKEKIEDM